MAEILYRFAGAMGPSGELSLSAVFNDATNEVVAIVVVNASGRPARLLIRRGAQSRTFDLPIGFTQRITVPQVLRIAATPIPPDTWAWAMSHVAVLIN